MKQNFWLVLATLLSASVLAQQVTNPPPANPIETPAAANPVTPAEQPAPAPTVAPAATNNVAPKAPQKTGPAKSAPKKTAKKQPAKKAPAAKPLGSDLKTVPLVAGPASVVASNVNVRGKAGLSGEVITRLTKGNEVTVLEEIVLKKSAANEPSAWAKIALPSTASAWVNSSFIDPTNKTVLPRKLNLRGGPGENYSILGQLAKGDPVSELSVKNGWIQISAPTNAYAFMAAMYLKQEPAGTKPVEPTPEPPTPAVVSDQPVVAAAPTNAPTLPVTPAAASNEVASVTSSTTNDTAMVTEDGEEKPEEPLPPRIVQREGLVHATGSIQAPTQFELVSPESGRRINYLYTTSRELDLARYKGLRIVVTGEESLDPRWKITPVITIQRIIVIE